MPLIQEKKFCDGIEVSLWHITETYQTLLELLSPSPEDFAVIQSFKHPGRQKQWLGTRLLIKTMTGQNDLRICYDANGKPYLPSDCCNISLSHSGIWAAAACSKRYRVGIDVEQIRPRILKVKERFLREDELMAVSEPFQLEKLHIYWGGKEALFKIFGSPAIDFRTDIFIHSFDYLCNPDQTCQATLSHEGIITHHTLYYRIFDGWMLVVAY